MTKAIPSKELHKKFHTGRYRDKKSDQSKQLRKKLKDETEQIIKSYEEGKSNKD